MAGKVQSEIKQKKPFRSSQQEAAVALLRTTDQLRRRFARVLEGSGITMQQYNVLRILRGAGEAGLPTLEIAERMIEETPGITRLIDRLEEKGLVRRERQHSDRRQVYCYSTPASMKLLAELDEVVNSADEEVFNGLSKKEVQELIRLLDKVRNPDG